LRGVNMTGSREYECEQFVHMLVAAIDDEHKAQSEYAALASKSKTVLCEGKCNEGTLASYAIQTIISDEAKHEKFLRRMLELAASECGNMSEQVKRLIQKV